MMEKQKELKILKEVCAFSLIAGSAFGVAVVYYALMPLLLELPAFSPIPTWVMYLTPIPMVIGVVNLIYQVNKRRILGSAGALVLRRQCSKK